MLFGALIVYGELQRAGRRWREAKRTWHEIEAVVVELRGVHNKITATPRARYGGGGEG